MPVACEEGLCVCVCVWGGRYTGSDVGPVFVLQKISNTSGKGSDRQH
jgi:hypothetical protein